MQLNSVADTVKIDSHKTGEPISKYIYGQFAEHLGKSINGGMWSEMLQDRKFYFPVDGSIRSLGNGHRS